MTLSPAVRKLALSVHLTSSVGWIGAVIAYLALGVASVTSSEERTTRAAWTAMELIGWWVIVPLAIAALFSGLVMSLGTRWGLFRHYWVLISLALTLVCTAVLLLHMPTVSAMATFAQTADADDLRALGGDLVHPGIGLLLLLLVTGLNVYKPAGLTPYGWRKQRDERAALKTTVTRGSSARARSHPAARNAGNLSAWRSLATRAGYFTVHFAEMWFAMLFGMAAFMGVGLILGTQGITILSEPTSVGIPVWISLFMVAPMAAWMRIRGCGWLECSEMSAVMLLPTGAALALHALALRDAEQWVSSSQHTLMFAAMLTYMLYRRERYTRDYSFSRWQDAARPQQEANA